MFIRILNLSASRHSENKKNGYRHEGLSDIIKVQEFRWQKISILGE
jgi:hypothetical protein